MSRRHLLSIGLVVLIVAAIASAAYFLERPMRVVNQAVQALATAHSQEFSATLDLANSQATAAALGEQGKVKLTLNGAYQKQSNDRPSLRSTIDLGIQTDSLSLQLSGEARFVKDKAYLLVNTAPPVWPILRQLKGSWIELPRGGGTNETATPPAGPLFTKIVAQGSEQRNGVSLKKYQVEATQGAIVRFMNTLAQVLGTSLSAQQIDNLRSGIAHVDHVSATLWITPFSHELRALETTLAVPGGNNIHLVIDFKNRNQTTTINAPDNAVSLSDALKKK